MSLRLLAPHPGSVVDIGAGASVLADRLVATARYAPAELAGLFGHAFTAIHSELEDHVTPWQARQRFTWVVLTRS